MQLVIGAGEFLGDLVTRTLAAEVPLIELGADSDEDTLRDAMSGVEVVHICANAWSPGRRLRFRKEPPPMLVRVVDGAPACLGAPARGEPGRRYIVGGFDSTWRSVLESISRVVDIPCEVSSLPYDLAYLRALGEEMFTPAGAPLWPGIYAVDVLSKPRFYDDSRSRRGVALVAAVGRFGPGVAPMKARAAPPVTRAQ